MGQVPRLRRHEVRVRLFVTGSRGQLGRALESAAAARGDAFAGFDLPELDITDRAAVERAVAAARPEVIVNCAAYTAVDAAESHEEAALAVNGTAVAALARVADANGGVLVQISTDYVFDGRTTTAYHEDDPVNPLSAYGRTKLAGERGAATARSSLIVRTAWLFGEGANFVSAIRRQVEGGAKQLRVVADQHGCPTYAEDLAEALLGLLDKGATGTVHAVNAGSTTWFEFAREIARRLGSCAEVLPISTAEARRPAPRPIYSVLDTSRLVSILGRPLPPWQDALKRYLASKR